jgi:hypothetical protein
MTMIQTQDAVSEKALGSAKFWVKRELDLKHLPGLPEFVEERLFLQGRTAWTYKYSDVTIDERPASKEVAFAIEALLKREFHAYAATYRYRFKARCRYLKETQTLEIKEIVPIPAGG